MSKVRTGGSREASAHLDKAREFLAAARSALDAGWPNAAASNAATAGINAKDALCIAKAGRTIAADDHSAAVAELRSLGPIGVEPANALDRLLGFKNRSQYDRRSISTTDAQSAVRRAASLVQAVERALSP